MGDPQGHFDPRAVRLLPRHTQEVARGELVFEDHEDGGTRAVVVGGPS